MEGNIFSQTMTIMELSSRRLISRLLTYIEHTASRGKARTKFSSVKKIFGMVNEMLLASTVHMQQQQTNGGRWVCV